MEADNTVSVKNDSEFVDLMNENMNLAGENTCHGITNMTGEEKRREDIPIELDDKSQQESLNDAPKYECGGGLNNEKEETAQWNSNKNEHVREMLTQDKSNTVLEDKTQDQCY
jgi:hypothetical protein